MATQPLFINQFDQAIADSPHKGFGLMRNVDIEAFPGAVRAQKALSSLFVSFNRTFTAENGADLMTLTGGATDVPTTGTAVTVSTTSALPDPLVAGTTYFIVKISSSTFKLATTIASAEAPNVINLTDDGTGTQTVTVLSAGKINNAYRDPKTGVRFFHDDNGRVWYRDSLTTFIRLLFGNTLTASSGKGIVSFTNSDSTKTYLFVFRNASIDVCNITDETARELGSSSWTNGWQSLATNSNESRHAILGQDNIVYYCNDRDIGSIRENNFQVFAPGTAATYTFNTSALNLPGGEIANWLEEQRKNLMIAGDSSNKIYPWDRESNTFNLPIDVPENRVFKIKNIGGLIYILAGLTGNIYITQGSFATHFKKLPLELIDNNRSELTSIVAWGGIAQINGSLIFGVEARTSANSGLYRLYPDGRLVIDRILSTGAGNPTAIINPYDEGNGYYIGYNGGIDEPTNVEYSALEAVIQSALFRVATKTEKGAYSIVEAQLTEPSSTGNIRIKYRMNTSSSFADFPGGAVSFAADGTNTSFKQDIGLIDIENIQVQAEIDDDVELLEIRLLSS